MQIFPNYLRFIVEHWRFLVFGVLTAALSGFGQTFYIAIFGAELRNAFDLSHGEYGLIYSLATLGSGVLIIWAGRHLDRVPLSRFVTLVLLGVSAGSLLIASAQTAIMLAIGLFLVRFCGQGLLTHVSATSMGRHFDVNRGKAVSIAAKGLPLAEAVMPAVGVLLITMIGWRLTWGLSALLLVVLFVPLLLWLLRAHDRAELARLARTETEHNTERTTEGSGPSAQSEPPHADWTRAQVLRDGRFYRVMPVVLAAPMIVTAMLFHLAQLAEGKDWSMGMLGASFTAFAAAHVAGLLAAGPFLDRLGPRPLLRVYLWPMAAGLVVVGLVNHVAAAWAFMLLMGLSLGGAGTLLGALWPELYGVTHLGAIRAVVHAAMVLSTAITPVAAGLALDAGLSMEAIALILAGYILAAIALAWTAIERRPTRSNDATGENSA